MRCLFAFLLATTTTGMSLTSCVADNDANEKSISDYSDTDVKSYGDLFQVFWSVMNQRYCTLNEQSAVSSQTWDQVYKEYKPKFGALKTFQHTSAFTQQEIQEDNAKAEQNFQEKLCAKFTTFTTKNSISFSPSSSSSSSAVAA